MVRLAFRFKAPVELPGSQEKMLPVIKQIAGGKLGISTSGDSNTKVAYEGATPITFGVQAIRLGFDANGKRIGFLDPGGYTYFHAPPGHYDIRQFWPAGLWTLQEPTLWKDLHVVADLSAGETRYVRLRVHETGASQCPGPATSVTEPDGSESRYFNTGSSVYDTATGTSYPVGSWCIGLNLAVVPTEVGRSEIQAQKFQAQNRAMPVEYKP